MLRPMLAVGVHALATEHLPRWLTKELAGIAGWQLLGVATLIFAALLLRRLVLHFVSSYLRQLAGQLAPRLEQGVGRAAQPLAGLSVAAVFALGWPLLGFSLQVDQAALLGARILGVASAVWLFYRQIDVISEVMAAKAETTATRLDDQLVPLVRRTMKVFAVLIGGIFVLQNLSIDVGSLIAGLGLGGLAFALAAKDTLANFFGSLVIFVDRPFQIGDWVIIGSIEGTVEDVGFRTTRIRTFYDSLVTVPNAKLTATAIDNMGARSYRRINVRLGLTYSTSPQKMQAFVEALRAIVAAHPMTRKDKYEIHFNSFGSYALEILFYVFVKVPSWSEELAARHEIFLAVLDAAARLGVSFAFPTSTLHIESCTAPQPPRAERTGLSATELRSAVESYGPAGERANPRFGLTQGFLPGGAAETVGEERTP